MERKNLLVGKRRGKGTQIEKQSQINRQVTKLKEKDGGGGGGDIVYLFTHLDDDVGVAATDVANGEINTAFDADSEKTEQVLHE